MTNAEIGRGDLGEYEKKEILNEEQLKVYRELEDFLSAPVPRELLPEEFLSAPIPEDYMPTEEEYEIIEKNSPKRWSKEGFVAEKEINKIKSPMVEVAGPTNDGFEPLVDVKKIKQKVHQSNLFRAEQVPEVTPDYQDLSKIDFQADATKLPIADNSVGALFVSCLSVDIRKPSIEEVSRVLEQGGLFIYKAGVKEDFQVMAENGLELEKYQVKLGYYGGGKWGYLIDAILRKV